MNSNVTFSAGQNTSDEAELNDLPEWNLADLYPGLSSPEFDQDLNLCKKDAENFAKKYSGKLLETMEGNPRDLAMAIAEYEQIEERMGRVMSYAGLVYAGDTSNPENAKFYGDAQENMTVAGSHLLFFTLEMNRLDDKQLKNAMREDASLAYYEPWLSDLRKDKPYQLDDNIEQLLHEKSVTGRAAWNRLFDETMSSLRFTIDGEKYPVATALNFLQDTDREKRKEAAQEVSRVLNENLRTFSLVTNTLAKDKEISDRWRGFEDIADSRHLANRVEREVVDALVEAVREAFPDLSHRYYNMKAKWLGLEVMEHWDRNAPLPKADERLIGWDEARENHFGCLFRLCSGDGRNCGAVFLTRTGLMHRHGQVNRRVPFLIRQFLPSILTS